MPRTAGGNGAGWNGGAGMSAEIGTGGARSAVSAADGGIPLGEWLLGEWPLRPPSENPGASPMPSGSETDGGPDCQSSGAPGGGVAAGPLIVTYTP